MLYNILVYPSKIVNILNNILAIKDKVYELELKFKCTKNEFNNYLQILSKFRGGRVERISDIVSSYNIDDKTNFRQIVNKSTNQIEYLLKNRIVSENITLKYSYTRQIDFALTLATEQTTINRFDKRLVSHIRERNRTSFFIDNFRFDLTEITTTLSDSKSSSRKTYEVEIEYLSLPQKLLSIADGKDKYIAFSDQFKKSLNLLLPEVHTLVSKEHDRYLHLFRILEEHTEVKPINIQNQYLQSLQNSENVSNYSVTNKLDGTKYNLFVVISGSGEVKTILLLNNTDIWLLYDVMSYKDITLQANNTIFVADAELLEDTIDGQTSVQLYLFDTIFSNQGKLILEKPHRERLLDFPDWLVDNINSIDISKTNFKVKFKVYKKNFIYNESLETSIQQTVRNMWNTFGEISNVERMNDGIIFQPYFLSYYGHGSPILKWKFYNKVSIDFLVKSSDRPNYYNIYMYNSKTQSLEEFKYANRVYYLYSELNIPDETIVETVFDRKNNVFNFYRYRHDKTRPNASKTAIDTFRDMIYPFLLQKIIDYLHGILPEIIEEEIEEVIVPEENIVLPYDKYLIEKLFFLPRTGGMPLSDKDIQLLQLTSEAKKYSIGFNSVQFIIKEIISILNSYNIPIERSGIIDCFGYSVADAISFATGKLAKGERPQKFYSVYSVENDETNYNTMLNNVDVYNNVYYANDYNKRLKNLILVKDDFLVNYSKIINYTKANVIFINKIDFPDIRQFVINIFKNYPHIVLIVIKTNPSFDYKTLNLSFEHKYNVLYIPRCLNIYRKFHNEVKSYMIKNYCNSPTILDLGSGKGGDLFKYNSNKNIQTIYLIEPNEDNIKELKERITKLQTIKSHDYKLQIVKAGSQDTDIILKALNKNKVDVVTSYFSLTFLFQNEELLNRLVDTIDGSLEEGGFFVGTVMDGYRTLELLNRSIGNVNVDCYSIKSLSRLESNTYGNKIEINLRGTETATTQTEYLVYLDLLTDKLRERNIKLIESIYFDDKSIESVVSNYKIDDMTDEEQTLNSLYRYFVFTKSVDKPLSENILKINTDNTEYITNDKFTANVESIQIYTHVNPNSDEHVPSHGKFVRMGAIGTDNNCFFHSLLITTDFLNYNKLDYNQRVECARKVREKVVSEITPYIFENINYGMIGYSRIVKQFYNNLLGLIKEGVIEYEDKTVLMNIIKELLFKKYPLLTNFTNRVGFLTESLINGLYKNADKLYIEKIRNIIMNEATLSREQAYTRYVNELLESRKDKFVKYIDNEDIQIISAVIGRQIIIICDETNAPVSYTSYNPN